MTFFNSVLLGIIQGLTEFLPVSSSGHLFLMRSWLSLDMDSAAFLAFSILLHLGTLAALLIYFRKDIERVVSALKEQGPSTSRSSIFAFSGKIACAFTLTAIMGLACKNTIETLFTGPVSIAIGLCITGAALTAASLAPEKKDLSSLSYKDAALIGIVQGLALVPGISRSGFTICCARLLGLDWKSSLKFSFILALPTIAAAAVYESSDLLALSSAYLFVCAAGFLVSLATGLLSLMILTRYTEKLKLYAYALYCVVLSSVILISQ